VSWLSKPRTQPYTAIGIRRVLCVRCGDPAVHQWQVCADGNHHRALCLECDIALNALVLAWANDPNAAAKMISYEARARAEAAR
jgi:hypothetical protein